MITIELVRQELEERAKLSGFALFGIAAAQPSPGFEHLREWLERGYGGTMSYIPDRLNAYRHPSGVLDNCQSVVMLGMPYSKTSLSEADPGCRIGNYACGSIDYHDLIRTSLNALCEYLAQAFPSSNSRGVVDTAPLMERDFAQLAGLGWIGKNTLLLNRNLGSYFFLSAILTDIRFEADTPFLADHCGTCTACLDACPTNAFVEPRVLDASRCISYLTIEHRGSIDVQLRGQMQDWLFGCDVCQMVCPWNRKPDPPVHDSLRPSDGSVKQSLEFWLRIDEPTFRQRFRKTPFWRTKLVGMQRNAMIVAANTARTDLVPLIETFANHPDQMLCETSRWAISKLVSEC